MNNSVLCPPIRGNHTSELIDEALNSRSSVSNRQMMVLRFWDHVHVADQGRGAVTEWLDAWYSEDEDRRAAWELWKEENGDVGRQGDPEIVPVGAGPVYLRRVKSGRGGTSPPTSGTQTGSRAGLVTMGVVALVILIVIAATT